METDDHEKIKELIRQILEEEGRESLPVPPDRASAFYRHRKDHEFITNLREKHERRIRLKDKLFIGIILAMITGFFNLVWAIVEWMAENWPKQ